MNVVIVGGSISGLMHGVVLKDLGHNIHILEARDTDDLTAEAAGLSLGTHAQEIMKEVRSDFDSYANPNPKSQFLGPTGQVLGEQTNAVPVITSSWNVVFIYLKDKFLDSEETKGKTRFETGVRVTDVSYDGTTVTVSYEPANRKGNVFNLSADLVIGADGSRSVVRSKVLPDVQPEYAGYVAWRGYTPELAAPDALKGLFEQKLLLSRGKDSYVVSYLTPGLDGSMKTGERLIDWVWYDYLNKDSSEFERTLTDTTGHRHNNTVPRSKLSQEVWNKAVENAKEKLSPAFADIISRTQSPFVTAISSLEATQASFFNGKLLLVGEAFIHIRPHIGLSSDLSASQALNLAKVLKGEMELSEWEKESARYGGFLSWRSKAVGHFGMTGKYPEDYVPPTLEKAE